MIAWFHDLHLPKDRIHSSTTVHMSSSRRMMAGCMRLPLDEVPHRVVCRHRRAVLLAIEAAHQVEQVPGSEIGCVSLSIRSLSRRTPSMRYFSENLAESYHFDRLHQMIVESGVTGFLDVFLLAVACDRH